MTATTQLTKDLFDLGIKLRVRDDKNISISASESELTFYLPSEISKRKYEILDG